MYVCVLIYVFAHICMPNRVCMCTIIVYLVYNHIGIAPCYHLLRIIFCINFFIRFCYECLSTESESKSQTIYIYIICYILSFLFYS